MTAAQFTSECCPCSSTRARVTACNPNSLPVKCPKTADSPTGFGDDYISYVTWTSDMAITSICRRRYVFSRRKATGMYLTLDSESGSTRHARALMRSGKALRDALSNNSLL